MSIGQTAAPLQVCVSDGFEAQYASKAAFMAALADQVNLRFQSAGVKNLIVGDVIWTEAGERHNCQTYPIATVCGRPGGSTGLLTVDRLRAAFEAQRQAAARDEGRLL